VEGGGSEVDVVEADGDVADAAQALPRRREELLVDPVAQHRQHHGGAGDGLQQALPRRRRFDVEIDHLARPLEHLHRGSGHAVGDDEPRCGMIGHGTAL